MIFDHCYQKMASSGPYFELGKRGFSLSSEVVEHPGKQLCRFLGFGSESLSFGRTRPMYLEFVELADFDALRTKYPIDSDERTMREPGFSLGVTGRLESFYQSSFATFADFKPQYSHKNYAWKHDDVSHLPGWNFLEFGKPIVSGMNIWFTEYEPNPIRPIPKTVESHANTATEIRGLIWNISADEAQMFARVSDAKIIDSQMALKDGTTIFLDQTFLQPRQKQTTFSAVVLSCSDWEIFCQIAKPDRVIKWRENDGALIEFVPMGWDILVVA